MENSGRYQRQIRLSEIGESGQQKLNEARVLVVGAGGLGCAVLQNLVAAGVGFVGVVDGDTVEISNLSRQTLYKPSDVGKSKVEAATAHLLEQNPEVTMRYWDNNFTSDNAFDIVAGFQFIVDCTDDVSTRYLINDVALVKGIPFVYASIHQFEGQLSVFNYRHGPTYRCLYPQQEKSEMQSCDDAGVLGVIPQLMGVLQATEIIKMILGLETVYSGVLLLYDGLEGSFERISLQKNALEIQNGLQRGLLLRKQMVVLEPGHMESDELQGALQSEENIIIDLREPYEEPQLEHPRIVAVPIDQLRIFVREKDKNQKIILLCRYGNKSMLAANYLMRDGFTRVFHLRHGLNALDPDNETQF